jgi:hypothetical protein
MPAVSIRVTGRPSYSMRVSTESRVVPGMGLTMARSPPRVQQADFPGVGLPTGDLTLSSAPLLGWKGCHQGIQEVACSGAVQGGHRMGIAQAQFVEFAG